MIKHFDVWPLSIDKNNLYEEQKIFLIYLLGIIPSIDDWSLQVDYKKKLNDIENIKDIELNKAEIDIAKIQNRNIEEIYKQRLKEEKAKKIKELNKSFGIETIEKETPKEEKKEIKEKTQQDLWNLLNRKKDGLQN